ncbi:MAG: hypothetical protein IJB97_04065 [Clostridia bacterium]|nr:hypothetical protein [Clostridia bacterium]
MKMGYVDINDNYDMDDDTRVIGTKNAEGVNEWVEYNFYLQGSSYADSTFTMVLGLGLGGGTDIFEYVNGYAFFDDVTCEIMTADKLTVPADAVSAYLHSDADKKIFKADETAMSGKTNFALDLQPNNAFGVPNLSKDDFSIGVTEEVKGGSTLVSANGDKLTGGDKEIYGELGFDTTKDVKGLFANFAAIGTAAASNEYLTAVYNKNFKDKTVFADKQTLLLMSADGAAYTAKLGRDFTVKANEKLAVSFFVKTSNVAGFTGAGVTLHDGENVTSFDSLDTSSVTAVKIGDNEDVYDGWQQCFFFVENDTDADKTFTLSFNYGKTTVYGTTKADYYPGFAAFTNFQTLEMEDKEYECASTGTYAKTVSLKGNEKEETTGNQFDSVASTPSDEIETTFADPKTYKGVVGGSAYITFAGTDTSVNSSNYAGLINKEYISAYETSDWATALAAKGETLTSLFGNSTQPLLIYNNVEQAYGFIGAKQTISADSYKAVSVRLKVSAGAKAYVYLADMDDHENKSILSIARQVSFWYDDDGNVCEEDPSENKSKSNIAFKLQSNGLYKANPTWSKASSYTGFYANLSNYEKDENGNLIVADGGVSYNYNEKWENEGNDGIAFYHKDGKYYADKACTIEVHNLEDMKNTSGTSLARYNATTDAQNGKLFYAIEGTSATPAWQTVTFYIHTGSEAKNFRLEVWSGSRDNAVKSAAGSYVLFDVNNPGDLTADSFTNLVKEFEDDAAESFKDTFSFYDSNKFLRYDETIDENEVGNSFKSYVSSAYSEGTAYLAYEANGAFQKFADYSLSEVSVAADVESDDTTTDKEETTTVSQTNMFLLASSLAIAAVLVLAVISLIVRKVWVKRRGKKARTVKPEKKSDKAPKAKKVKPAKNVEEPKDENDPYND